MKQQTLRKIGNSVGIIIPNEVLKELNLKEGDSVYVDQDSNSIIINKNMNYPKVSPEFLRVAEKVSKEYDATFKELASKWDIYLLMKYYYFTNFK